MAELEARSLQKMFDVGAKPNLTTEVGILRKSSWALDQPLETIESGGGRIVLRIDRCRTQETRLSKSLSEFPCKNVRFGYLKSFVKALNPDIKVKCIVCPPDEHSKDSWCQWAFET